MQRGVTDRNGHRFFAPWAINWECGCPDPCPIRAPPIGIYSISTFALETRKSLCPIFTRWALPIGTSRHAAAERQTRWQMFTDAAMAKGFEDTAFDTYTPLISLNNEVGCDPFQKGKPACGRAPLYHSDYRTGGIPPGRKDVEEKRISVACRLAAAVEAAPPRASIQVRSPSPDPFPYGYFNSSSGSRPLLSLS